MKRHSRSQKHDSNIERDLEESYVESKKFPVKNYLVEYTVNSNLHGLKYIGEKERTPIEKFFWFTVFTCSVVLCAFSIKNLYIKWSESPVIVSFDENTTPVWQIPHPAVTICFETKSLQSRFNFTKYFHLYRNQSAYAELTEEERQIYEDSTLICNNRLLMAPVGGLNFSNGKRIVKNVKLVAPKISDFLKACLWRGNVHSCETLFSPILTGDGLCYTFNTIGAQELFRMENIHKEYEYLESNKSSQNWSREHGYASSAPLETYPHRGLGYGMQSGLSMLLLVNKNDLDYVCKGGLQGYKIWLHHPAKIPRSNEHYYRIPFSREVILAVTPQVMTTSDGLRSYKSLQRKCYFENDRYLRYYKMYSQNNCEIECLTNFTYARCGCVHFGMPHAPDMQVCSAGSLLCIRQARLDLVATAIQSEKNTSENDTLEKAYTVASQCKCLPACTSIKYNAEISQAYFDAEALYKAYGSNIENIKDIMFSGVEIFFKEAHFIASRRSELYGRTDFLANCGGILGLCMGFSILSVAEIIYFLTLRIIMWHKRNPKNMIHINE